MPERPATRILIVDDEKPQMHALCDTLGGKGYSTTGVSTPASALAALRAEPFDLLLTDLMMPEMDGAQLLRAALELEPDLVSIVMTGHGSIDSAVEAMKSGALDYILKPFKLSAILPVLTRAETVRRLRLEKKTLAQRVKERTAELETTNRDLEAFASSVSHDLRAPARTLKGFSQLLLGESGAALSGKGRHYLNCISESAEQMGQLIEALLKLSRLGRHALSPQRINVQTLVQEIIDGQAEELDGREVEVRVGPLPDCRADPVLLKQVWFNLLSNAFKYTHQKLTAVVEVGCDQREEESIYYVRDNGAGFEMQYADKLFRPFQRLHSDTDFAGSGIGLSTVRRILERHGGRIWADAVVNHGATFYFTIPPGT
ncbi:response regulator [bacterium]|nr:response regulator [bacterium]